MGPSEAESGTAVLEERPIPRSDGSAVVARGLGEAWVIVELAPDAIMVIDEQGHIVLANRAAETMFGYDRDALVRLGVDALVPQVYRQAHRSHRDAYDASPRTRPMGLDLDLKAQRADGSEFPVEISLSPVTFGDGSHVVAIVREVTAHRTSELAMRKQLVRADQERIGAELLDQVIRRLFAAGMNIQAVVHRSEPDVARRLLDATDELDLAIHEIRAAVFRSFSDSESRTAAR